MSDIEKALAEALHECGEVYADCHHREDQDDVSAGLSLVRVYRDCGPKWHEAKAAAILATEPMQAIARVVEAAEEVIASVPASYDHDDPMVRRHAKALNALAAALDQEAPTDE